MHTVPLRRRDAGCVRRHQSARGKRMRDPHSQWPRRKPPFDRRREVSILRLTD